MEKNNIDNNRIGAEELDGKRTERKLSSKDGVRRDIQGNKTIGRSENHDVRLNDG